MYPNSFSSLVKSFTQNKTDVRPLIRSLESAKQDLKLARTESLKPQGAKISRAGRTK